MTNAASIFVSAGGGSRQQAVQGSAAVTPLHVRQTPRIIILPSPAHTTPANHGSLRQPNGTAPTNRGKPSLCTWRQRANKLGGEGCYSAALGRGLHGSSRDLLFILRLTARGKGRRRPAGFRYKSPSARLLGVAAVCRATHDLYDTPSFDECSTATVAPLLARRAPRALLEESSAASNGLLFFLQEDDRME